MASEGTNIVAEVVGGREGEAKRSVRAMERKLELVRVCVAVE